MEPGSPSHSTGTASKQSVDAYQLSTVLSLAHPGVRAL